MTPGSYQWRPKLTRRSLVLQLLAWGQSKPQAETSQFDLSLLDDWLTPTDLFFVREHFPAPAVTIHGWKLSVGGAVEAPFEIPYDDLVRLERKVLPVTLECAENPVGGGLVSTAEWAGVSLKPFVERARPRAEGRFVRLTGADGFSRSIPLDKAIAADTLVAWSMNGNKLAGNHGFPWRAIVPGWYGMSSVKWLRSVEVTDREDPSEAYRRRVRSLLAGVRVAEPVQEMLVKSVFSRPVEGAILTGRRFRVRGAAWGGPSPVQSVEVSTDGGKAWGRAGLGKPVPYAWTFWEHEWKIPGAGEYELVVRAGGQPPERASDRVDQYEQNGWQRIRVAVR